MGCQIHSRKKCAKIIKISVASCCLVCCLRRGAKDRMDMETKLPSPCSPSSFSQVRLESIQWAGQGAEENLHGCCFDWICLGQERSQVQDSGLQPTPSAPSTKL